MWETGLRSAPQNWQMLRVITAAQARVHFLQLAHLCGSAAETTRGFRLFWETFTCVLLLARAMSALLRPSLDPLLAKLTRNQT